MPPEPGPGRSLPGQGVPNMQGQGEPAWILPVLMKLVRVRERQYLPIRKPDPGVEIPGIQVSVHVPASRALRRDSGNMKIVRGLFRPCRRRKDGSF